jgi:hypothetical protein
MRRRTEGCGCGARRVCRLFRCWSLRARRCNWSLKQDSSVTILLCVLDAGEGGLLLFEVTFGGEGDEAVD